VLADGQSSFRWQQSVAAKGSVSLSPRSAWILGRVEC